MTNYIGATARRVKSRITVPAKQIARRRDQPNRARLTARMAEISAGAPWSRADEVFTWARTDRGGRQFSLLEKIEADAGLSCSSQYGLCE